MRFIYIQWQPTACTLVVKATYIVQTMGQLYVLTVMECNQEHLPITKLQFIFVLHYNYTTLVSSYFSPVVWSL